MTELDIVRTRMDETRWQALVRAEFGQGLRRRGPRNEPGNKSQIGARYSGAVTVAAPRMHSTSPRNWLADSIRSAERCRPSR